jgi:hypothetical protein
MSNSERKPDETGKPWFRPPIADVVIFLLGYGLCFVMLRFNLTGRHTLHHPMTNRNAAIFGLVVTVVALLYWKWKHER